jgi:hypothetical protein
LIWKKQIRWLDELLPLSIPWLDGCLLVLLNLSNTLPGKEQAADATEQLLESPKNAARLRDAISTPQSERVAFESLDELKDALGIYAAGFR